MTVVGSNSPEASPVAADGSGWVYIDMKDKKSIVSLKAKPAFLFVIEMTAAISSAAGLVN